MNLQFKPPRPPPQAQSSVSKGGKGGKGGKGKGAKGGKGQDIRTLTPSTSASSASGSSGARDTANENRPRAGFWRACIMKELPLNFHFLSEAFRPSEESIRSRVVGFLHFLRSA